MPAPSELEPRGQFPKAPEGTFKFLKGVYDANKSEDYRFQVQFVTNKTIVTIEEEAVCDETGGSCMDLRVYEDLGDYNGVVYHAHITDHDSLPALDAYPNSTAFDRGKKVPPAEIERMLRLTRKLVEQQPPPF